MDIHAVLAVILTKQALPTTSIIAISLDCHSLKYCVVFEYGKHSVMWILVLPSNTLPDRCTLVTSQYCNLKWQSKTENLVLCAITSPEFWILHIPNLTIMLSIQLEDALINVWVIFYPSQWSWTLYWQINIDKLFCFSSELPGWLVLYSFTFIYTTVQTFRFGRFL